MNWRRALALAVLLCVAGCGVKSELVPPGNKPPPKSQPNPSKPPSSIGQ